MNQPGGRFPGQVWQEALLPAQASRGCIRRGAYLYMRLRRKWVEAFSRQRYPGSKFGRMGCQQGQQVDRGWAVWPVYQVPTVVKDDFLQIIASSFLLRCHTLQEAFDVDDDAFVPPIADHLLIVTSLHIE